MEVWEMIEEYAVLSRSRFGKDKKWYLLYDNESKESAEERARAANNYDLTVSKKEYGKDYKNHAREYAVGVRLVSEWEPANIEKKNKKRELRADMKVDEELTLSFERVNV